MTYLELCGSKNLIFKSIRGSHLFGLETPESDIDTYSVFCCPQDWLYGTGLRYQRIIEDQGKDNVAHELSKWISELSKSNPDALISLFTPADKILTFNPILTPLFDIRESLVTKECFKSFRGYAKSQIGKAKGLGKAMNIDPKTVERRKSPLEFCWTHIPGTEGVWTLEKWLRENGLRQEHCGLVRLPGGIEYYVLFYDWFADKNLSVSDYSRLRYGITDLPAAIRLGLYVSPGKAAEDIPKELEEGKKTEEIKYRGIILDDPGSTQLRLSSITKEDSKEPLISFQYNMNSFSQHCRQYKEYHEWVKSRNPRRYEQNLGHSWDSKNACHCLRIMRMATEIAQGKGIILDRAIAGDRDFLLQVKSHGFSYDEIMKITLETEEKMLQAFENSTLPDSPNPNLLEDLMIEIRRSFYTSTAGKSLSM